jgi:hypothetical protein
MDKSLIHGSHDVRECDGMGPDPHSTGWWCTVCRMYTCLFCPLGDSIDDAELEAPCTGDPYDLPAHDA